MSLAVVVYRIPVGIVGKGGFVGLAEIDITASSDITAKLMEGDVVEDDRLLTQFFFGIDDLVTVYL